MHELAAAIYGGGLRDSALKANEFGPILAEFSRCLADVMAEGCSDGDTALNVPTSSDAEIKTKQRMISRLNRRAAEIFGKNNWKPVVVGSN